MTANERKARGEALSAKLGLIFGVPSVPVSVEMPDETYQTVTAKEN